MGGFDTNTLYVFLVLLVVTTGGSSNSAFHFHTKKA